MAARSVSAGLLALALAFAFVPAAYAVKPKPPVTVKCITTGNQAFIYEADCTVAANGPQLPVYVRLSTMQDNSTKIAKYEQKASNGIGVWHFVIEARDQKPYSILFDAYYPDGTLVRAVAVYDPYKVLKKPNLPAGVVKQKKEGGAVKEYPSN